MIHLVITMVARAVYWPRPETWRVIVRGGRQQAKKKPTVFSGDVSRGSEVNRNVGSRQDDIMVATGPVFSEQFSVVVNEVEDEAGQAEFVGLTDDIRAVIRAI